VIFDGTLLRDLIIQVPVVALLLVFIWLERRAHEKTITAMRDENAKLQQALIDHEQTDGIAIPLRAVSVKPS
jgi:hypothetical protein